MTPFEAAAHGCGLATLPIDLPGMGESGVAGTRLRCYELLGTITQAAANWLLDRAMFPVFTFGVSGEVWLRSPLPASMRASPRVWEWAADTRWRVSCAACRRSNASTISTGVGSVSLGELRALLDGFELAPVLSRVAVPCLIVHGARDEVVPLGDARRLAWQIAGPCELRIEREDDHMCTHALEHAAPKQWFEWLWTAHAARSCQGISPVSRCIRQR